MEYLLSFLILALNLFDYEININKYAFLAVGTVIMALLFYVIFRKTKSFLITCMCLMCHTWQISWINIFGEPTANMQLPWFYIIGALVLAYGVVNIRSCFKKFYNAWAVLLFAVFIIIFNYPLLFSPSLSSALKDYIMIAFFIVVLFVCYLFQNTVSRENYVHFQNSMIWAVFLSCFAIVFQYMMYTYAKIGLFKIMVALSFSGYQTNCFLLMEDHSCSTIMLGCVVFYMLERIDKKRWVYMLPALATVIVAMAVTSRRTSTLSLIIVIAFYVLFHYKGVGKKVFFTVLGVGIGALMLYYLLLSRPVDSFSQMLSDNGRYENFAGAFEIIKEHPLGIGYDDAYNVTFMPDHKTAVHNTILRWCIMAGIPTAVVLCGIIAYTILQAAKKKVTSEYWAILYTMFASNFIPDVLNARFFVILCSVAFLIKSPAADEADRAALAVAEEKEKVREAASLAGKRKNAAVSRQRAGRVGL